MSITLSRTSAVAADLPILLPAGVGSDDPVIATNAGHAVFGAAQPSTLGILAPDSFLTETLAESRI